jgi:hypothetical protein
MLMNNREKPFPLNCLPQRIRRRELLTTRPVLSQPLTPTAGQDQTFLINALQHDDFLRAIPLGMVKAVLLDPRDGA